MTRDFERREALAFLGVPVAASLLATTGAGANPRAAQASTRTKIDFETWMGTSHLVQSYADCADRGDSWGIAGLFVRDGVFEYGPEASSAGRDAIDKFLGARLIRYARTIHLIGSPAAIMAGASAGSFTGYTPFMARHEWHDGKRHTVYGRYVDHYQRDQASGEFRFSRRRVVAQCVEGEQANRYWLERVQKPA